MDILPVTSRPNSPVSDSGYSPLAQYPASQIGDGNGLGVGDWRFALAGVDPMNPTRPVPPLQTDSKPASRLLGASGNTAPASWPVASSPADLTRRNADLPLPIPQLGRPLGFVDGKLVPLPLSGPAGNASGSGGASWLPAPAVAAWSDATLPASAIGFGAPAVPVASSDRSNSAGGQLGMLSGLTGIDPRDPSRFAPPELDDALRGYYQDDPAQPWLVRRGR